MRTWTPCRRWLLFVVAAFQSAACMATPPATEPLAAATGPALPSLAPTPSREDVRPSSAPPLAPTRVAEPDDASPTARVASPRATYTPVAPTPAALQADVDLPALQSLALTQDVFETGLENDRDLVGYVSGARDATSELADTCLLDCSKTVLDVTAGTLTVILLRAGDAEKAARTVAQARAEFERDDALAYEPSALPELFHQSADAWVMARRDGIDRDSIVGVSRGPIVVLVIYDYDICSQVDGQWWCEGDVWYLTGVAVRAAVKQLEKLAAAGL